MHDGRAQGSLTGVVPPPISPHADAQPSIHERPTALIVAVPLYRSPELLPDLTSALIDMAPELQRLAATVLFINDSPDDETLAQALQAACERLAPALAVDVVVNEQNLGFIASANRALEAGLAGGRDVILLNSDALPRPGAFAEMIEVAYLDPLISVVSPRSDNATICNSPVSACLRDRGRDEAWQAHRTVAAHLPRMTYVPTAVGFCLLVKRAMIAEFGLFDPVYGAGYNEENDFIRRCNQRGYRAVLANHAYVHHIGECSFGKTDIQRTERDRRNLEILIDRYPEYERALSRYFQSPDYSAERVLDGLAPFDGKLGVLFDCRVLGAFFNGTFEHITALLRAFATQFGDRFHLRVMCTEDAFSFHSLGAIPGLALWTEDDALRQPSAIAFRLSQPDPASLATLQSFGAVTGALMLDTIALDCQQLDDSDLHELFGEAAAGLDLIGFNSAFTRDQFIRRFRVPKRTVQFVSLCSTDPADYAQPDRIDGARAGILLVGNHYPHKNLIAMLHALRAAGSEAPVTVLGLQVDEPGVVASYRAGEIPQDVVERLYGEAAVLLFPSHYEGFGLPIMHALARRVPVIARDLPCAREIKATCPAGHNLHLCGSTQDMAKLALAPPPWRDGPAGAHGDRHDWNAAAAALATAFEEALRRFDFAECVRHQIIARRFAEARWVQDEILLRRLRASRTPVRPERKAARVGLREKLVRLVVGRERVRRRESEAEWSAIRGLVMTNRNRAEGLFDAEWYLSAYPDVLEQGIDPLHHYIHHGAWENRDPGPNFNSAFYLETYLDVAASGMNPLVHYLESGREQGCLPTRRSIPSSLKAGLRT